jgi:hypothetical protein
MRENQVKTSSVFGFERKRDRERQRDYEYSFYRATIHKKQRTYI